MLLDVVVGPRVCSVSAISSSILISFRIIDLKSMGSLDKSIVITTCIDESHSF
jgi:hypothetical protein